MSRSSAAFRQVGEHQSQQTDNTRMWRQKVALRACLPCYGRFHALYNSPPASGSSPSPTADRTRRCIRHCRVLGKAVLEQALPGHADLPRHADLPSTLSPATEPLALARSPVQRHARVRSFPSPQPQGRRGRATSEVLPDLLATSYSGNPLVGWTRIHTAFAGIFLGFRRIRRSIPRPCRRPASPCLLCRCPQGPLARRPTGYCRHS